MKKYILPLLLACTTLLSGAQKGISLTTAFVGMSMDYREYDDDDAIFNSEKSNFSDIIGTNVRLAYAKNLKSANKVEFGAGVTILSGETEYVGSLLTSSLGYGSHVSTTNNFIFDTDIDYKYTFLYNNGFEFTYGVGLGYRVWRRALSETQKEDYAWFSLRPKIALAQQTKYLYYGIGLEYQYGINPTMTILADSENSDTTVNLGSADILQLTLPLKFNVNSKLDLFMEYVYQHQTIGKSDTAPFIHEGKKYNVHEPRSVANNQYVKFGAVFKF